MSHLMHHDLTLVILSFPVAIAIVAVGLRVVFRIPVLEDVTAALSISVGKVAS